MKHLKTILGVSVCALLFLSGPAQADRGHNRGSDGYRHSPRHHQAYKGSHRRHRDHGHYRRNSNRRHDYRRHSGPIRHRPHRHRLHRRIGYGAPLFFVPSYRPYLGSAISVWIDGIGFSYYESGDFD